MKLIIITGICGSGKSYYCKDKVSLSYDSVFSYQTTSLDYDVIERFFETNKLEEEIYLDAFNKELINYIVTKFNIDKITCKLLYADIDNIYECLAITEPRDFGQETYDGYVNSIINTNYHINNLCKEILNENLITDITYVYRDNDKYKEYLDESHFLKLLSESKNERLLKYIDSNSGHASYQSILLDKEYIRKGTEQDWITFENILKCTTLKNKVVMDTGCFNGYFSFKSLENGAKKVIGVDQDKPALKICDKLCIYNNYHLWKNGTKIDNSCEFGIHFYEHKIGIDNIFDNEKTTPEIDIIFAFNYLHHLKNAYGQEAFINTLDSFFSNSKEVIFEVNENEIDDINQIAEKYKFILNQKIESHRKTSFGNRWVLYFRFE